MLSLNHFTFSRRFSNSPSSNLQDATWDGKRRHPNSAIEASSKLNIHYGPENARLNYKGTSVGGVRYGGWIPSVSDNRQWLQVDFGTQTQVTGISIQGFYTADYWVKSFSLRYSNDKSNFYHYQPDSYTQVKEVIVNSLEHEQMRYFYYLPLFSSWMR